ncbi:putative ATP-dependent RNA helicase [Powai lake megavirus]|uniref:Putative ATP-dependent RNA helicase n=1 Tax=Powai lake megavirus TaxID=1842663 RepID=A0A167RK70_9VIRU|nr:putative ATP-dependent RNA helicase [Powai lake megavirus]ANB50782.1 putative ATP-dependent RNA helicase [Powai lake megavirus]
MSKYINVDDENFYSFINKKYEQYKIPEKQKTFQQICFPKTYEFQIPQKFLAEFINPKTPYKGILVYHRIGAGKTCTAINIAENFKTQKNIMVVLPASLKGNFRSELRSLCAGNKYLSQQQRDQLKILDPASTEYSNIIKKSDELIDKYYTIYSYNKFVDLIKNNSLNLSNTLLIIDEVHNMISETGTYYQSLYETVQNAPDDFRLVIMSATPIFDKPNEIALTMNLLLRDRQLPVGQDFINEFMDIKYNNRGPVYQVKNMDVFKDYIKGYVSYYRGAPPYVFPKSELFFVRTRMSDFQKDVYKSVAVKESKKNQVKDYVNNDISNSFFIGTRMISNIVFPNGKTGLKGFESISDDDFDIGTIQIYSPKFLKIFRKIKKCRGTVFVYSNFKEFGGIRSFVRLLEHHKFKNYEYHGTGKRRFAIWSGDQDPSYKEQVKAVFNNRDNEYGDKIKVILGSSSIKEGVSFMRVQEVHIIEPYWNFSRMDQVIGRAIRFCSHKDVEIERQIVKVYIYLAVHPDIKMSIDERMMKMAIDKKIVNHAFEQALKEAAVDCELFKNANIYPGEPEIQCDL